MNKFLVVSNKEKDSENKYSGMIKDYLNSKGCECQCENVTHNNVSDVDLEAGVDSGAECVLVLGGDGTLIQVAGCLAGKDVPLLGINLGTLGYLAEIEKDQILPTLDRLIKDEYDIEERIMLTSIANNITHTALNDIVITRMGNLRVVSYRLFVNGKCLSTYDADGMIISTPTGSTGYNLSAGGPIVEPSANTILVTPICPHTLNTRAVVLSADDEIRVEIGKGKYPNEYEAFVSCDGSMAINLKAGDVVDVKKSSGVTKIIKMSKESFLDVLSRKMDHS